jgi:eukaryotic-like serine/threonine-protein kinase
VLVQVVELVEGETLAGRLQRGPLAIEHALKIAHQIAQALEAAHENAIIHRDLKPANVKITPDEQVQVLDFGLAKALGPPEGGPYVQPGVVLARALGPAEGGPLPKTECRGRLQPARSDPADGQRFLMIKPAGGSNG